MHPQDKQKSKREKKAWEYSEAALFQNAVASVTECTGMTPTVPETEEEALSYHILTDVPVTAKDGSSVYTKENKKQA